MISGEEIHVLDKNAEFQGIPTKDLMENAGKGVADFIKKEFKLKQKNILIFCGLGNNGGDGFVAARYLCKIYNVTVFLVGKKKDIKTDIAKKNFKKLKLKIYDIDKLDELDRLISENRIIIDSMLGIGITGKLRKPYSIIVKKINSAKSKKIISVDVPTGLGTNLAIKPNYTITFHDIKESMIKKNSGNIKIVDIGIPQSASKYVGPGELITYYPKPKKDSHKGQNGNCLIVGGGPYYGAPALSCFAAQRTGCDLVFIATPKKVAKAITSYSPLLIKPKRLAKNMAKLSPNLIVKETNDDDIIIQKDIDIVKPLIKKVDTLIIGPGLGSDKKTLETVKKITDLFVKSNKSIVIDADAIKIFRKNENIIKNSKTILTPHTGEFYELTGKKLSNKLKQRIDEVEKWAKKLNLTIILKGPVDIISNGKHTKLNDVHNVAMTAGGTGDVLAGINGALLSKGVDTFNAARISVFVNGYAGNLAYKKRSYGLVATDIIDEIPNVLKKFL